MNELRLNYTCNNILVFFSIKNIKIDRITASIIVCFWVCGDSASLYMWPASRVDDPCSMTSGYLERF